MLELLSVSFVLSSFIAPALSACSYSSLQALTAAYVTSQTTGQLPTTLISNTTAYTENFAAATLSSSILSQPLKIDHNRSLHDTEACATFTELIITDRTHPYVIGTQIRANDDATAINQIDTLVSDAGDWLFNVTGYIYWTQQEDQVNGWAAVPTASQDTRAVLKAAADAYLDRFHDTSIVVPWGTPCARLEGGAYTGRGSATDSCDLGVPDNVQIVNRKYVIDETLGTVDIFLNFGANNGNPDSHMFRVNGGKLRYIHTITIGTIQN